MHQRISHFLSNPPTLLISTRYIFISLCKIIITCGMISLVKRQHLASDFNNLSEFSTFYWDFVHHKKWNPGINIRNKPNSFSEWTKQGPAGLLFPYNAMAPPLSPQCVLLSAWVPKKTFWFTPAYWMCTLLSRAINTNRYPPKTLGPSDLRKISFIPWNYDFPFLHFFF